MLRVALVGEESAGRQVLQLLVGEGHDVVVVLTSGRGSVAGSVRGAAEALGLPVRPAEAVRGPDLAAELRRLEVDLLLNVHALHVIHPDVLGAPRIGSFNLHPGPLPAYAGLNAPSWAVYHRERRHAVTLHWITPEIDAGPVAWATDFDLRPRDTGLSVFTACVRHGVPLVRDLVRTADRDPARIPRTPQDPGRRRWFGRKPPAGGRLHWSRSAREITAFVRASDYGPFPSPWGRPTTALDRRELEVLDAQETGLTTWEPPGTVGNVGDHGVQVAAGDEWVSLRRVRVGERTVDATEVLRSGQRLGAGLRHEETA